MTRREVIHKIKLDMVDDQPVDVPVTARFVAVDRDPQDERAISVWYRRTTDEQATRTIRLSVVSTGQMFPIEAAYLGSVVTPPFIWHVLCYED